MRVALQFDLLKREPLAYPRFRTAGPVTRHLDAKGYEVTTGIGPDLMQAARASVRSMVDLLGRQHGCPPSMPICCAACAAICASAKSSIS
jgi:acetamidase/formamidase